MVDLLRFNFLGEVKKQKAKINTGHIIRQHMAAKFLELRQAGKLFDFLPDILAHEFKILENWEKYFKSIKIPYAVTEEVRNLATGPVKYFILWKEGYGDE